MVPFILLFVSSLVGLIAIFFTTFGTFIIVVGVGIFAWMTDFMIIDLITLFIIFLLYVFGEILEYLAVIFGVKKVGASNAAVVGAIVGGIFGAILGASFFGVGVVFGTLFGIFGGAFLFEWLIHQRTSVALKAGIGGVLGRLASIAAKLCIAAIIFSMIGFKLWQYSSSA